MFESGELAAKAGQDPKDYLLKLLGPARRIDTAELGDSWNYGESPERYPLDVGRLRGVIEEAARQSGWGGELPRGRARGIAAHYSFVTYVAVVIEVEVKDDGALLVHKATIAADCGPQINPERIRSQLEGACVMGLGLAALGEISFKDGKVQQDNFHQYELARMPLAPKAVSVHLLKPDGDLPLGGVGEPGVPPEGSVAIWDPPVPPVQAVDPMPPGAVPDPSPRAAESSRCSSACSC